MALVTSLIRCISIAFYLTLLVVSLFFWGLVIVFAINNRETFVDWFNTVTMWFKYMTSGEVLRKWVKLRKPTFCNVYEYNCASCDDRLKTNALEEGTPHSDTNIDRWHELPCDIMGVILQKNCCLRDRIRLSGVCKSWNEAVKEHGNCHILPMWLYLYDDKGSSYYYSLLERQVFKLIYESSVTFCQAMNNGWLLMMEEGKIGNKTYMKNLLTRVKIQLPPLRMKKLKKLGCLYWAGNLTSLDRSVHGVASTADQYLVVSNPRNDEWEVKKIVFCRTGERNWSILEHPEKLSFDNIILINGKLYVCDDNNKIWICEFIGKEPPTLKKLMINPPVGREENWGGNVGFNLIETSHNLLLVVRNCDKKLERLHSFQRYRDLTWKTSFEIFKVDQKLAQWVKVESMIDHAIFLGDGGNRCLPSATYGLKGNSIYFLENITTYSCCVENNDYIKFELMVYNIEDNNIESYSKTDSYFFDCSIWFEPH